MGYIDVSPTKGDPSTFTITHHWDIRPWFAPHKILTQTKVVGTADDLERALAGGDKFAENKHGRGVAMQ
jgi:hypothetical protein